MGWCGGFTKLILTVSPLGGYGGLERTDFNSFYLGQCGVKELMLGLCSLEISNFYQFIPWVGAGGSKITDL